MTNTDSTYPREIIIGWDGQSNPVKRLQARCGCTSHPGGTIAQPCEDHFSQAMREAAQRLIDSKGAPADPELFERTAPAWNCVTDPRSGPHYLDRDGDCQWCGATSAQIAAERTP